MPQLNKASLLKLYMVLSRSYFDRFRTGSQTDADAARAYLYASRAIDCDSGHAEGYRMRGVSALSRYRSADAARKATDEFKALLLQAKSDLMRCSKLDPHNAGAVYNLALLNDQQGNRAEAIRLPGGLIVSASVEKVRRRDQEKYFPDVYINLGCYLADQLKAKTDTAVG